MAVRSPLVQKWSKYSETSIYRSRIRRSISMVPERILFKLWLPHLLFSWIHCFFFRPPTKTMNRGFTVLPLSMTHLLSPYFHITCHFPNVAHFYPDTGGSVFLQNTGTCLPDFTVSWLWGPQYAGYMLVKLLSFRDSGKLCPISKIKVKNKHKSVTVLSDYWWSPFS
jgi:hypothetical protein